MRNDTCLKMTLYILFTLKIKTTFVLITLLHFTHVLADEPQNESLINATVDFNYDDFSKNESIAIILFNETGYINNSTELFNNGSTNATKSGPVVTEDWQSPETAEPNQKYLSFTTSDEDICTCDLTSDVCDINCCCDPDCTDEHLKVFSKCESRALIPDKNYCYQKDIIFRNNTVYKLIKDPESTLFCIVHDNLKMHLRFKELPAVKSHRDLDVLLKYQSKNIPSWNDKDVKDETEWGEIRAGNPIHIEASNPTKRIMDNHWNLPSSCFSRLCSCRTEIHYLEDFTSTCTRPITKLTEECKMNQVWAADRYTDFCISPRSLSPDIHIRLTDLISHTKNSNSTDSTGQVTKLCIDTKPSKPKYEKVLQLCLNVVSAINFTIWHDGFNGILKIGTEYTYVNVSQNEKAFIQHFKVSFKWNNTNETLRRSGNPGYQVGLPIVIGTNSSSEFDDYFSVMVQPGGLEVTGVGLGGKCGKNRQTVKFGKNLHTSCNFRYGSQESCRSLQDRVYQTLFGSAKTQIFIAVFGNANGTNSDDWIEAYHETKELTQSKGTCYITTDLNINVAFAAVGTIVNPQFKVIGVGYHYNRAQKVDLSCESACPELMLSTSVSFFDVTEPAVPHYPRVPSIKANLPSDFFYPFIKGNANSVCHQYLVIFICFILHLIFK